MLKEAGKATRVSVFLHKLNLSLFRSYEALRLDFGTARYVVLTGANGAGKTNILEAISLLAPGKGLRGADLVTLKNQKAADRDIWAVAAEGTGADGMALKIATALDHRQKKRVVRINGKDASAQTALAAHFSAVWLTPQMDRIFQEGLSARRRFLDRLVYARDMAHAGRLSRFEKNARARLKILQGFAPFDERWLGVLEAALAADSVAIAAARLDLVDRLRSFAVAFGKQQNLFPVPRLDLSGATEKALRDKPALGVEEELQARFSQDRLADRDSGRTQSGALRCDFMVEYAAKNMPAALCSTGEQKGLLLALTLAHAQLIQSEQGRMPVLLFDEVAAHLDAARRDQLFDLLGGLQGQVFFTGTDADIFKTLLPQARFFDVRPGQAVTAPLLQAV